MFHMRSIRSSYLDKCQLISLTYLYHKALTGEWLMLCVMVLKPNKQQCHKGSCIAVAEEISLDSEESSKTSGTLLDEGCCHSHAKS